ncbi:tetratricopeptide repeat protein [Sinomicrobium weinanense]|uniref:Tetratricopeptide repeat protein n=1 Tax=Sinomicrobium weinanense TaxID=2842200 RepID=A0A926JV58_9FLAO|nr:tetratricopeptide repeat protein [Sinomicrobium weinanense]MBC9797787.1 tetratricopeptide repeat protein [Sinomicrobium weinanense]MBU3124871.1 tetratricopeptide repeat protein [Sinomicrobium weinanense]
MQYRKVIPLFASCCFMLTATAQMSEVYTYNNKDYEKALELYNNKQYRAAQLAFEKVKRQTRDEEIEGNSAYYIAGSAIRLEQSGAETLMENFVSRYPTSTKRNTAYMDAGDYYFQKGKYPQALKWYDKAEDQGLSAKEQEAFNFKKGYALFTVKRYNDSKNYLNKVSGSEEYGAKAKYYLGYMAYEGDDYNEANQYFDQVAGEAELNKNLSYYQADMNFKAGKFEEAIRLAKQQLPKSGPEEVSELNKIIGESYFNLKEYEAAVPYLKGYKGKQGRWNNTDFYQLGYAYYKQGDYENAIGQFNKIVGGNDSVAQNAYYHLAECYLNTGKKQQALNAFRNASQMEFDERIQEDALLNYARLSYEIGNPYQSVPEVLLSFLEKYPGSGYKQEIENLLVDSYVTSKNYDAALKVLEENKTYNNKEAYQKVAFYYGMELFRDGKYEEAMTYFEKSVKEPQDRAVLARATYWRGEAAYELNKYNEALVDFKDFKSISAATTTPEYDRVDYQLGYTYFKQKNYEQAITYFDRYVKNDKSQGDRERLNDAWLRLGDSYFVSGKYWPAMEAYNEVIAMKEGQVDYAHFQKAISYGFVDRTDSKIDELNSFINNYPDSGLRPDAMYTLGNAYVSQNKVSSGVEIYNRLVKEYPMSPFVPKTLLREGLVYYNAEENDKALDKFRNVVDYYPNTPEAVQAVSTAKLIYVDMGRVDEYANWVRGLDFVEVTDADLDNATYESAEKQFAQNNADAAIKGFEAYLDKFPRGLHALEAHFYTAQSYFVKGKKDRALPHYEKVTESGRNEFTEQSLARLGQIFLDKKDYKKAVPVLKRLEEEAGASQNTTFAKSNLMKANYELKNYPEAIRYARSVLENKDADDRIKSDAHIMIARAAIEAGDEATAKEAYAEVKKIATGALAAEALYYDAYFKNKEGNYEASNESVQKLAGEYSGYKEFGAKGLLLMAKNFYALDDAFQATYILENVIKNFKDYPEVVEEARNELTRVKAEEAKRNSSVNPNNN